MAPSGALAATGANRVSVASFPMSSSSPSMLLFLPASTSISCSSTGGILLVVYVCTAKIGLRIGEIAGYCGKFVDIEL